MHDGRALYRSSVGQKVLMAVSGAVLVLFVLAHMLGNLKVYQGAEKFDAYATFLREVGRPLFGHGQLLWLVRVVLLVCLGVHLWAAAELWLRSRRARPVGYRRFDDLSFHYASRTMRWGGVIVLVFVLYHLAHLTTGTAHPDFRPDSAYHNLVRGFRSWPVSLFYIAAMAPLGLHVYHGLWSGTQTLAVRDPRILRWRRLGAALVGAAIVAGNVSIPLAVLAGWLR